MSSPTSLPNRRKAYELEQQLRLEQFTSDPDGHELVTRIHNRKDGK